MGNLMREQDLRGVHKLPELPAYFNKDEDYGSMASKALFNGGIEENLLLDTYARITPPPIECLNFIGSQFLSPSSALPKQVPPRAFLEEVFKFLVYFIDMVEPELLFHGLTDVILSQDKFRFQYLLKNGDKFSAIAVSDIDVYQKFASYQYNYTWLLKNPGLFGPADSYGERPWEFDVIWEYFKDCFENTLDATLYDYWEEYFGPYFTAVSHIALWSTLMWVISPHDPAALAWRSNSMWVYKYMQLHDEVIMYGHALFTPDEYIRTEVEHGVCVICNTQLHCANIYDALDGNYLYFCQAHRPRKYAQDGSVHYPEPESIHSMGLDMGFECNDCDNEACPVKEHSGLSIRSKLGRAGQGQILMQETERVSATKGIDFQKAIKSKLLQEF